MLASAPRLVRFQCAVKVGKRGYHDLVTLPSQKPVVSYGPPGYSAESGRIVTVFGCTGFLGRYVVSKLGKVGTQVICPYRDEDEARILKPMGDLGQIVRMEWDIRSEKTIAECLRHSDTVINLVGRDYETKNFDYDSVNVIGAERIAKIAKENGVERFIQVSHLNASEFSQSKFYASKAKGEQRVKEVFPEATIVRPSALFGYEDKFLTNMAIWPIWWKLNNAETTVRPVHVMDVAQALVNLLSVPKAELGRTLNLPGPATYTYQYLLELVASITVEPVSKAPVLPKRAALLLAKLGQSVWWPTLSPDEVIRRYINDSDVPGDWEAVGIPEPAQIESLAITYLRRYRSAANFVRPVVVPPRPGLNTTVETQ